MYLIRRGWRLENHRETRLAATLVTEIGGLYEEAGQRQPVRVYFNSGTTPGDKGVVYMEWTADTIESPYRDDNVFPDDPHGYGDRLRDITTETWIEFHELMTPAKRVELES